MMFKIKNSLSHLVLTSIVFYSPVHAAEIPVVKNLEDQISRLKAASIHISEINSPSDLLKRAKITEKEARAIIEKKFPHSKVAKVDLDNEQGALVYSVSVTSRKSHHDFKVDAGNGQVLYDDQIAEGKDLSDAKDSL